MVGQRARRRALDLRSGQPRLHLYPRRLLERTTGSDKLTSTTALELRSGRCRSALRHRNTSLCIAAPHGATRLSAKACSSYPGRLPYGHTASSSEPSMTPAIGVAQTWTALPLCV